MLLLSPGSHTAFSLYYPGLPRMDSWPPRHGRLSVNLPVPSAARHCISLLAGLTFEISVGHPLLRAAPIDICSSLHSRISKDTWLRRAAAMYCKPTWHYFGLSLYYLYVDRRLYRSERLQRMCCSSGLMSCLAIHVISLMVVMAVQGWAAGSPSWNA